MKKFLKSTELQLINGGYLSDKEGNPVTNEEFIKLQKDAEFIITFASLAKGKDFKGKTPDSLEDLTKATLQALSASKVQYVDSPKAPKTPTQTKLMEEAMSFINFKSEESVANQVNNYLQKFNTLKEFEEFGLFFEPGITKLNRIYTVKEITEAVTATIDLL